MELKAIAPESDKVAKAREKLRLQFEEQKVTPEDLKSTAEKISAWIADHAKDRLPVKGKSIRLFDGNANPARVSKKVSDLAMRIQQNF